MESILEIINYLEASKIDMNGNGMQEATVELMSETGSIGNVSVTVFTGQHSAFGPYFLFGDEIRSFGIHHTEFKSGYKFPQFKFDKANVKLNIIGADYDFSIQSLRVT